MLNLLHINGEEDLPGGMSKANFHIGHVNYYENGLAVPIDMRFTNDGHGFFIMNKANYTVKIPENFNSIIPMKFNNGWNTETLSTKPSNIFWLDNEGKETLISTPQNSIGKLKHTDLFLPDQTIEFIDAFGKGIDVEIQARGSALLREIIVGDLSVLINRPSKVNYLAISFDIEDYEAWDIRSDVIWNKSSSIIANTTKNWSIGNGTDSLFIRPMRLMDKKGEIYPIKIMWRIRDNKRQFVKLIPIEILDKVSFPIRIDDSTSYWVGAGDGEVRNSNANYVTCRTAATGSAIYAISPYVWVGQATGYIIFRIFLPINTNGLSSNAIITGATMNINLYTSNGNRFNAAIVGSTQSDPTTLAVADFANCGVGGTGNEKADPTLYSNLVAMDTAVSNNYSIWTLNSTGLAAINRTGYTKLGLRSDKEYTGSGTAPTVNEYMGWYMSEQTGTDKDPYLSISYYIPGGITTKGV